MHNITEAHPQALDLLSPEYRAIILPLLGLSKPGQAFSQLEIILDNGMPDALLMVSPAVGRQYPEKEYMEMHLPWDDTKGSFKADLVAPHHEPSIKVTVAKEVAKAITAYALALCQVLNFDLAPTDEKISP